MKNVRNRRIQINQKQVLFTRDMDKFSSFFYFLLPIDFQLFHSLGEQGKKWRDSPPIPPKNIPELGWKYKICKIFLVRKLKFA